MRQQDAPTIPASKLNKFHFGVKEGPGPARQDSYESSRHRYSMPKGETSVPEADTVVYSPKRDQEWKPLPDYHTLELRLERTGN